MKNDKYSESARKLVEFLKSQAKAKGISESEIARRTGLKQQNVNRLFNFKRPPTLETFIKVADAIDFEVDFKHKQ